MTAFSDEGRRVVFRQLEDDHIRAGLALANEKWAGAVTLSGIAPFRRQATALADSMGIAIVSGALRQELTDLGALSKRHGKPIQERGPSAGARLSGRLVDVGVDADGSGRAVIDAGRVLAVVRIDARTVADFVRECGERVRAFAGHDRGRVTGDRPQAWRIYDLERAGPERSPDRGL